MAATGKLLYFQIMAMIRDIIIKFHDHLIYTNHYPELLRCT